MVLSEIEEIRKNKNISIKDMAESLGITSQGLYQLLKKKDLKVSQLQKIADVLDVDVCVFFQEPGKNKFEEELKYFIEQFQPVYSEKSLLEIEDEFLHYQDNFLQRSLSKIYDEYNLKSHLEYFNKKYNRSIKILSIETFDEPKGYSIAYSENDEMKFEDYSDGKPDLYTIFKELFKSMDDIDVRFIREQTYRGKREFLLFIENSTFIDWYKKTFNIKDHIVQSVLMDISRRSPIILDS